MIPIVLSGLTAAGKTTHAALLASALGVDALHATDILVRELAADERSVGDVWFRRMRELESLRDHSDVDDRVDAELTALVAAARGGPVVDSWAFPWYWKGEALRIWMGSDRLSRAWKCSVSARPAKNLSTEECAALIDEKDEASRERFLERYGFDLYTDRTVFDFVLDNSHLICAPTSEASRRGIRDFHTVLSACVESGTSGESEPLRRTLTDERLGPCVVGIGERLAAEWGWGPEETRTKPVLAARRL